MNADEWRALLAKGRERRPTPIRARSYRTKFPTNSTPVVVVCDDGNEYVCKGRHMGRVPVTDQVVGRLGMALGAPVGQVALVNLPADLIAAEAEMQHMPAGVAHASLVISDTSGREGVKYTDVAENRPRFALLALLYGWFGASDHQMIYNTNAPHLVHSVDHGHFLPGSTNWSPDSLRAAGPAEIDQTIAGLCRLTNDALIEARGRLAAIDEAEIAHAVAAPPDEWCITDDDRLALVTFLGRRRQDLLVAAGSS